jgi:hypothetical protein
MLPLSENALDEMVSREKDRGMPPLTDWDTLSSRLRAEGLIRDTGTQRFGMRPWMRMAAAVTLAVGGAAVGRASAGAPLIPAATVQAAATEQAPAAEQGALASNTGATFSSPEEAWEVLNRSGEEYQRASAYLSENNNQVPMPAATDQYRTRLAALDNVLNEMRDAMKAAPEDPVINQYYLAAAGSREATLRQLGTVLPASAQLNRF